MELANTITEKYLAQRSRETGPDAESDRVQVVEQAVARQTQPTTMRFFLVLVLPFSVVGLLFLAVGILVLRSRRQ